MMRASLVSIVCAAVLTLGGCSDSPSSVDVKATVNVEKPNGAVIVDPCNAECRAIVEHRRAQAKMPLRYGN